METEAQVYKLKIKRRVKKILIRIKTRRTKTRSLERAEIKTRRRRELR